MASKTWIRTTLSTIAVFAIGIVGAVAFVTPAAAASVTVITETELSDAIIDANNNPGPDQITLGADISLSSNLPLITDDLDIIGANFTIDGNVNAVFTVLAIDLTLRDITIIDTGAGYGLSLFGGNLILSNATFDDSPVYIEGSVITVAITDSVFNNSTQRSGLSFNVDDHSTVTIDRSEASANLGHGIDATLADDSNLTVSGFVANLNNDDSLTASVNDGGEIEISDSTFNTSVNGVGVSSSLNNGGHTNFSRVTVSGNAEGGVVLEDGLTPTMNSVAFVDSTISDNSGVGLNMVGDLDFTDVLFDRTTISGNTGIYGGGIYGQLQNDSSLTIASSTISGNRGGIVGAIYLDSNGNTSANLVISHSTIVDNSMVGGGGGGPGGLGILSSQYTVDHSVIAGNTSDGSIWDFDADNTATGTINYSLIQNPTNRALTSMGAGVGNIVDEAALLGPLANNGGLTLTHMPLADSPVINAGNPTIAGAPSTDQRGAARILGVIDLGSVEATPALAVTGVDATPFIIGGGILFALGGALMFFVGRRKKRAN